MKVPFPIAIGIRDSRCYTFLWLETKNPRFCSENCPREAPKKPFFDCFFRRSLSQTRRSLSAPHRLLSQTRRSFFGYCRVYIAARPLKRKIMSKVDRIMSNE